MTRKSPEQRWADKFCKNIELMADKIFGRTCSTCGQVIDGNKPGHPRHCKGCCAEDARRPHCNCNGKGTCDECRYQHAAANCDEEGFYKL